MLQGGDGFKFTEAEVLLPAGLPYAQQVLVDLKLFPQGVSTHPSIKTDCALNTLPCKVMQHSFKLPCLVLFCL
jgi:hypothetical protein